MNSLKINYNDIDISIRKIVKELNKNGYKTWGSCAGHSKSGFITFYNRILRTKDRKIIKRIFEKQNIINLRFGNVANDADYSFVEFPAQEKV